MAIRQSRALPRAIRSCTPIGVAICLLACGDSARNGEAAHAPPRSGDVWEVGPSENRREVGAELLAFVSGTHVLLVDGNDTYAGMRVTRGGKAPDGGQPLSLAGGIEATLAPAGDSLQLRFASGESVALHRRATNGGAR